MSIRDATMADVAALLAIYNDAVRTLDAIWTEDEDDLSHRAGNGSPTVSARGFRCW